MRNGRLRSGGGCRKTLHEDDVVGAGVSNACSAAGAGCYSSALMRAELRLTATVSPAAMATIASTVPTATWVLESWLTAARPSARAMPMVTAVTATAID